MPGAVIKNVRILTRLVLLRYYEIGVPLVNMECWRGGDEVGWAAEMRPKRRSGDKFRVQAPGDGEGQGSLVCCSPWGFKESEQLSD